MRCDSVPEPSPLRAEGCDVAVLFTDWYRMISIPRVCNSLFGVLRDAICQMKWAWNMMCLSDRMSVLWLKINCAPWASIGFRCNHHARAPRDRHVGADLFQDTNLNVPLQVLQNLILPMYGHQCWLVYGHWLGIWIHVQLQRLISSLGGAGARKR